MNLVEIKLPNGYSITAIEQSKTIVDEIWHNNMYDQHFDIQKGMKILDLGANLGFFSLYAASKGALVYGFEPEKQNYTIYTENIRRNNLQDSIIPNNLAVAKDRKSIDIFFQDFNKEYASGMVTTCIELVAAYKQDEYKKQTVRCTSLKEILDTVNGDVIDLIKIDCEGAEFEILQSAPVSYFRKIKNIVMETHDTYSEKEMFYLLRDLGFGITGYHKRSGVYNTGYIFAENNQYNSVKEDMSPVAIIKNESHGIIHKKIILDGSASFSRVDRGNKLSYNWFINGKCVYDSNYPVYTCYFEEPGRYEITMQLADEDKISEEKRKIWIFDNLYFEKICDIELAANNDNNIFEIDGEKSIVLKKEYLPEHWNQDYIIFGISFPEGTIPSGYFRFNNRTTLLNDMYTEIKIMDFCHGVDLKALVGTPLMKNMAIKWWIDMKRAKRKVDTTSYNTRGVTGLHDCSEPLFLTLKDEGSFVLHHENLPTHWEPEYIVIGIKVEDPETTGIAVVGSEEYKIESGWQEIRLERDEIKDDICMKVKMDVETKIKIVWWAE